MSSEILYGPIPPNLEMEVVRLRADNTSLREELEQQSLYTKHLEAERDKLTEAVKVCEVAVALADSKRYTLAMGFTESHVIIKQLTEALALIHTLQSGEKKEGSNG